jgi:hypothetical protein
LAYIATPPRRVTRRVTLSSHEVKMSSLPSLYLLATFRFVTSPQAKIEALNPYYRHRPPSSDSLTPTLYYY